ncbi:uncharacterized protein LOC117284770 [Fukomys damarensis]|uniref:uncharacterized protein LOC117284770 n=1 Tax=Fukomys damarensis TaxID=885580 RepID=UPI00145584E8|nr:uncharacterized protein LOC117284770 [Fukomys damarensis]
MEMVGKCADNGEAEKPRDRTLINPGPHHKWLVSTTPPKSEPTPIQTCTGIAAHPPSPHTSKTAGHFRAPPSPQASPPQMRTVACQNSPDLRSSQVSDFNRSLWEGPLGGSGWIPSRPSVSRTTVCPVPAPSPPLHSPSFLHAGGGVGAGVPRTAGLGRRAIAAQHTAEKALACFSFTAFPSMKVRKELLLLGELRWAPLLPLPAPLSERGPPKPLALGNQPCLRQQPSFLPCWLFLHSRWELIYLVVVRSPRSRPKAFLCQDMRGVLQSSFFATQGPGVRHQCGNVTWTGSCFYLSHSHLPRFPSLSQVKDSLSQLGILAIFASFPVPPHASTLEPFFSLLAARDKAKLMRSLLSI